MDIHQTVVLSVALAMKAFEGILRRLDSVERNSLSTATCRRLVAYELLASPEITQFNHLLVSASGQLYVEQQTAGAHPFSSLTSSTTTERGCAIVRCPLLLAVDVFFAMYQTSSWDACHVAETLARRHLQTRCCWYSAVPKKACSADAVKLSSSNAYVFCRKHWPLMLGNCNGTFPDPIPSSEMRMDDWLQSIV